MMMNEDEEVVVPLMNRDFSELPIDILSLVIRRLFCPSDLVWFGAVCANWRSALIQNPDKHFKSPTSLPVLLLVSKSSSIEEEKDKENQQQQKQQPHNNENEKNNTTTITRTRRGLYCYSLYDGKFHDFGRLQFSGGSFLGSNHGWVVVANGGNHTDSVKLLNPFFSVNNEIQLPSKTTCKYHNGWVVATLSHSLIKAVISASPSSSNRANNNVVAMAIHGSYSRKLSFCKPGDKTWTVLPFAWNNSVEDVIFYKGLFYCILETGLVLTIEVPVADYLDIPPKFNVIEALPIAHHPADREYQQCYLVESSGELLKVMRERKRIMEDNSFRTTHFQVFKLTAAAADWHDHINFKYRWVETKSLDGCSLFVSYNASVSLSASHFSHFPGIYCRPNCIYFTYEYSSLITTHNNIGIYSLEDMSFETQKLETDIIPQPSPIWVYPTL